MDSKSTLAIITQMVKDNNQGVMMSPTVYDVDSCEQGGLVTFGTDRAVADACAPLKFNLPSKYIAVAFFIDRKELEKYR